MNFLLLFFQDISFFSLMKPDVLLVKYGAHHLQSETRSVTPLVLFYYSIPIRVTGYGH